MRKVALSTYISWTLLLGVATVPLVAWTQSVGNPLTYLSKAVPPGQALYVMAKLAGLMAFCLMWLQAMMALARGAGVLKGFPVATAAGHRKLGLATLVVVLLHVGLFITAASLRKKELAIELLLPNFSHGHYFLFVGLGAIAFWLLLLSAFAGWRTSLGNSRWKVVHMIWPLAFGLIFVHAYAIGTESRYGFMRYFSVFIAVSVCIAITSRLIAVWRERKRCSGSRLDRTII